jgi:hypothetical protein
MVAAWQWRVKKLLESKDFAASRVHETSKRAQPES